MYYYKYVNDNQQTINQYQRIFSKIQKGYNTQNLYSQKVNDTQIHHCTNIDKTYQCKSRKLVKTQIPEIINGNPEITKGGGLSQTGA